MINLSTNNSKEKKKGSFFKKNSVPKPIKEAKKVPSEAVYANLIKFCIEEINKKEKYKKLPKNVNIEYGEFIRYSENMEMLAQILNLKFFDFRKELPSSCQILTTDNKYLVENNIYCLQETLENGKKNKYILIYDVKSLDLNRLKTVELKDIALVSLHSMNLFLSQNNEIKATVDPSKGASDYMYELFTFAKINKASDIKFSFKSFHLTVRMLVSNGWKTVSILDRKQAEIIRSYLEVKSGVESGSKRYDSQIAFEDDELRIGFFLTKHGFRATVRMYNSDFKSFNSLKDIGYTVDVEKLVSELSLSKNGMIILSAPTGNGKTTTQNIILEQLALSGSEIVSVEHPVEKSIAGIDQVDTSIYASADEENKVTSKTILKDFLRAKPDIISGGELRDKDDYQIGLEIALTGHLFFGSTHSLTVKTTLRRFVKNGVDEEDIKTLLRGVICQTLTRRLCDHCKIDDKEGGFKSSQKGCRNCKYGYENKLTPIVEIAKFSPFTDWSLYDFKTYENYISLTDNANLKYSLGHIDKIHRDSFINNERQPKIFEIVDDKYLEESDKNFLK